jgi:hypothetical protein
MRIKRGQAQQKSQPAKHAFSQTALGKRGFATGWLPRAFIRCDQHVGLSFWTAGQSMRHIIQPNPPPAENFLTGCNYCQRQL